jgi:hypothetical protein
MLASEGCVNVVGSRGEKKQEKNVADCSESVTVVRVGSAANVDGPHVFLAKDKEIELASFQDFANNNNFPAPVGSHVEMTPNAYMTDDAGHNICPKLCQGIRAMKGVLDNCWVVFSLDGFGSHLDAESSKSLSSRKKVTHLKCVTSC